MTNAQMQEIWRLVTAALNGGQKRFQVQVYPFRMSSELMAKSAGSPHIDFWETLKAGNDLFEANSVPPKVSVCESRYRFQPGEKGSAGSDSIDDKCTGEAAKS
jgi:murein L,D-transpeptidase YafK